MKNLLIFIVLAGTFLLASCSKEKDFLAPKADQNEAEQKISTLSTPIPSTPIPWPRTSLKRIQVFLQGAQMVPAIRTSTKGSLSLNLFNNKYVGYRLTLTNLEPGDFATSAVLYQGIPGTNGSAVFPLFFGPFDNGVNKGLLLSDDQFNTLTFLLNPAILPTIPNTYFVVTTKNYPGGIIRGKVNL